MADETKIHRAGPSTKEQAETGVGYCDVCRQRVHRVPGGQGPTWVHTDTGAVAAPGSRDVGGFRQLSVPHDVLENVKEAAQEAADAAHGDSNDGEIEALRDALECALSALGLPMPEAREDDEED